MYEVRPWVDAPSADYDLLRRGRVSHDEVLGHAVEVLSRWGPSPTCPTRLLVAGADVPARRDIERLREQWSPPRHRNGLAVRVTVEPHAELLVLDGDRVRITTGSAQGRVVAWSREAAHARAAAELFELWWSNAMPGFDLPPTSPWEGCEPLWDVDEWDPDEAAGL